jgi:hypothetical protein
MTNHSIAGSWFGQYGYEDEAEGATFEAVFLESRGYIEGSMLDDCSLGEAFITGSFVYPTISFTKKYRENPHLEPIEYRGSMSEDGKTLLGVWWIKATREDFFDRRGTWTAFREGSDESLPIQSLRKELQTASS